MHSKIRTSLNYVDSYKLKAQELDKNMNKTLPIAFYAVKSCVFSSSSDVDYFAL